MTKPKVGLERTEIDGLRENSRDIPFQRHSLVCCNRLGKTIGRATAYLSVGEIAKRYKPCKQREMCNAAKNSGPHDGNTGKILWVKESQGKTNTKAHTISRPRTWRFVELPQRSW